METTTMVELIGYLASALIVLSLLMASVLRLRVINLIGAVVFTAYGVLIGSWPVIIANAAIVLIDIYYLVIMLRDSASDGYFEVVEVEPTSAILDRFVAFHADDIARFQPDFEGINSAHLGWMVLRDGVPVGVVLARRGPDDVLDIEVDYVTAEHRDFTAGSLLYGDSGAFGAVGATSVRGKAHTTAHRRYLARMGFVEHGDHWSRSVD